MFNINGLKLKYYSPAYPPKGIESIDCIFTLISKNNEFYIDNGNKEIKLPYDLIKKLFQPIEYINWFEVERFLNKN